MDALLACVAREQLFEPRVGVAIRLQFLGFLENRPRAYPIPKHNRVASVRTTAEALADLLFGLNEDFPVPCEPLDGGEVIDELEVIGKSDVAAL